MPLFAVVALVVAGVLFGLERPSMLEHVFGQATLYVFLPPLLFEAAWNLDARELLAQWRPILMLSVPGVVITAGIVSAAAHLAGLPWTASLLLGAVVSATDPIAIVATFKGMPVPMALNTIVQSESLLNDAMAVVAYRAVLAVTVAGAGASVVAPATLLSLAGVAGGIAFGIACAYAVALMAVRRNTPAVQILATLIGAYAVYFGADRLELSGIFAAISFGIALRKAERHFLAVDVAHSVERSWDVLAVASNAVVFFLTGAAVEVGRLIHEPFVALAALAGIVLARVILAYTLTPLAMGKAAPRSWFHVVQSASARGALALALALALPAAVAGRSTVVDVTFAVVLVTLIVSTWTVPRAVRAVALSN